MEQNQRCTYIVIIGATRSSDAISIPISEIHPVSNNAQVGSPVLEPLANIPKNGMMLSLAMACRRRGAPVRDCRPAPTVDRNEPIRTTHSVGHAIRAASKPPPILSPYLGSK